MNFQKYVEKGEVFLKQVAEELGCPDNLHRAGRVTRSTFHVLRDQSTPEESMQLISQLPMVLKAIYVDSWSIGKKRNRFRHVDDFLARFQEINKGDEHTETNEGALFAVKAVIRVMKNQVSAGGDR